MVLPVSTPDVDGVPETLARIVSDGASGSAGAVEKTTTAAIASTPARAPHASPAARRGNALPAGQSTMVPTMSRYTAQPTTSMSTGFG